MHKTALTISLALVVIAANLLSANGQMSEGRMKRVELSLSQEQASHFANLALKCVSKEYPNKPEHVMNDPHDVQNPKALHPAFYGCYDWHSSVHGHWMLVRLLRLFPNLPEAAEIRKVLGANLTATLAGFEEAR